MNKKILIGIFLVILIALMLLMTKGGKNKSNSENQVIQSPQTYTYQKSEESSEDLYVIYDEQGNEVNSTNDEMLVDAIMHLYEIDPDYDG